MNRKIISPSAAPDVAMALANLRVLNAAQAASVLERRNILLMVRDEANAIRGQAREDAEGIAAEARENQREEEEKARVRGAKAARDEWNNILAATLKQSAKLVAQNLELVASVAAIIAERIVGNEFQSETASSEAALLRFTQTVLDEYQGQLCIAVRANGKTIRRIQEGRERLQGLAESVTFIEDKALAADDLILEYGFGPVDASVSKLAARASRKLIEVWNK